MEIHRTQIAERRKIFDQIEFDQSDQNALQRLDYLLALNAENVREKQLYRSEKEKSEAEAMEHPLDLRATFSYFGLLLGALPPAAFFLRIIFSSDVRNDAPWLIGVWLIVNFLTAIVGYFSGRLIAKMVRQIETYQWTAMIMLAPFLGMLWGIIAGSAGGVIIFVIGALFGASIGAMVGGAAMPLFLILHRWLKKGEFIERRHFLPIAFGITLTICSFIIGFPS